MKFMRKPGLDNVSFYIFFVFTIITTFIRCNLVGSEVEKIALCESLESEKRGKLLWSECVPSDTLEVKFVRKISQNENEISEPLVLTHSDFEIEIFNFTRGERVWRYVNASLPQYKVYGAFSLSPAPNDFLFVLFDEVWRVQVDEVVWWKKFWGFFGNWFVDLDVDGTLELNAGCRFLDPKTGLVKYYIPERGCLRKDMLSPYFYAHHIADFDGDGETEILATMTEEEGQLLEFSWRLGVYNYKITQGEVFISPVWEIELGWGDVRPPEVWMVSTTAFVLTEWKIIRAIATARGVIRIPLRGEFLGSDEKKIFVYGEEVSAIDISGKVLFSMEGDEGCVFADSPKLFDVDRDGKKEILALLICDYEDMIYVWDTEGELERKIPLFKHNQVNSKTWETTLEDISVYQNTPYLISKHCNGEVCVAEVFSLK